MYNKLFTKILDSSVWMESNTTRIVWFTLLAAMDGSGFCQFASLANLAHRARVTMEEAKEAVECLEGPDENSSDPENEGRRIERMDGGWIVLNADKYRKLVTAEAIREKTRERVARFRAKKRSETAVKRTGNADVTQSEAEAEAEAVSETTPKAPKGAERAVKIDLNFEVFWKAYPKKVGRGAAEKAWKNTKGVELDVILAALEKQRRSPDWTKEGGQFVPHPATWLNQKRWSDELIFDLPASRRASNEGRLYGGTAAPKPESIPDDV